MGDFFGKVFGGAKKAIEGLFDSFNQVFTRPKKANFGQFATVASTLVVPAALLKEQAVRDTALASGFRATTSQGLAATSAAGGAGSGLSTLGAGSAAASVGSTAPLSAAATRSGASIFASSVLEKSRDFGSSAIGGVFDTGTKLVKGSFNALTGIAKTVAPAAVLPLLAGGKSPSLSFGEIFGGSNPEPGIISVPSVPSSEVPTQEPAQSAPTPAPVPSFRRAGVGASPGMLLLVAAVGVGALALFGGKKK